MVGQIGHREVAGALCRTFAVRECSLLKEHPLLESARSVPCSHPPPGQVYSALGRPFGRVEGTIRRRQDDLLGAERRWRGLGVPVNTVGILETTQGI